MAPSTSLSPHQTETLTSSFGLPKSILLPILESLCEDVTELLEAFQEVHLRMVGGSLLIIYEGDWERAAEGVKLFLHGDGSSSDSSDTVEKEDGEGDEDDEEDEEENESESDEEIKKRPRPPYTIKLIDFAHTRITPGQGSNQGVLLGLNTVRKLLDGRIEQVCNAEG
jgi:1D-myo-inositol-tetrakisphosphate 5-kinase/inositol-polyphosphate multikinase